MVTIITYYSCRNPEFKVLNKNYIWSRTKTNYKTLFEIINSFKNNIITTN